MKSNSFGDARIEYVIPLGKHLQFTLDFPPEYYYIPTPTLLYCKDMNWYEKKDRSQLNQKRRMRHTYQISVSKKTKEIINI